MESFDLRRTRPRHIALARFSGLALIVLSLAALVLGLFLTESLATNLRATVSVTRSALTAIGDTVESVDMVASDTVRSLEAASGSVDSASATVDGTITSIENVASFLESELPATIDSIRKSMPAAIQTANAIDGTLRALSLFGVNYNPDEPFGESLSRVNTALSELPGQLKAQSESLRRLIPSAEELAGDTERLSASMEDLTESLRGFTSLTGTYRETVAQAELAIDRTDQSVETSVRLMRGLLIGLAVGGVAAGLSLIAISKSLQHVHQRIDYVETMRDEPVGA